jgi:hypothetical protein
VALTSNTEYRSPDNDGNIVEEMVDHRQVRPTSVTVKPAAQAAAPFSLRSLAEVLELTVDDLRHCLGEGRTVAEVADDLGVPIEGC